MKANVEKNEQFVQLHVDFRADGLTGPNLRLAVMKKHNIKDLHSYRATLSRLKSKYPVLVEFMNEPNNKKTKTSKPAKAKKHVPVTIEEIVNVTETPETAEV